MDAANSNQMIGGHTGYGMFLGGVQRRRDDGRSGGRGGFFAKRQEFKNTSRLMNQGAQLQGQLMDKAANNAMTQTTHGANVGMAWDTHSGNIESALSAQSHGQTSALSAQEHGQNVERDLTQGAIGIRHVREEGKRERAHTRTQGNEQRLIDTNASLNTMSEALNTGMIHRENSQQKFDLEQAGLSNLPGHVKGIRDAATYGDLPDKKASAKKTAAKKTAASKPTASKAPAKKAPAKKTSAKKASTPRSTSRPKPMGQVPVNIEVPGLKLQTGGVHAGDGAQTKL